MIQRRSSSSHLTYYIWLVTEEKSPVNFSNEPCTVPFVFITLLVVPLCLLPLLHVFIGFPCLVFLLTFGICCFIALGFSEGKPYQPTYFSQNNIVEKMLLVGTLSTLWKLLPEVPDDMVFTTHGNTVTVHGSTDLLGGHLQNPHCQSFVFVFIVHTG